MSTLGSRDDWRRLKARFGIPDKVCKFSLGEKLGAFEKQELALDGKDYPGLVAAFDQIVTTMKTYQTALGKLDAAPFKGKSPGEKATNLKNAKDELKQMIEKAERARDQKKSLSEPMMHIYKVLPGVLADLKKLDATDEGEISAFYGKHMRNTLGLSVKEARKQKLGANVLAALDEYETLMGQVNDLLNDDRNNAAQAMAGIVKALQVLGRHVR